MHIDMDTLNVIMFKGSNSFFFMVGGGRFRKFVGTYVVFRYV